jgi:hypothetical protein
LIRVERDPAFWERVASHPAVAPTLSGMDPAMVGRLAADGDVLPLASAHGGFLFVRRDGAGFVCELHTLFTPEGWGREALAAGILAIEAVWITGYQAVITFEPQVNPRGRPPRTFGFARAGDWRETPIGPLRLWILSRQAWDASPAKRRSVCPLP